MKQNLSPFNLQLYCLKCTIPKFDRPIIKIVDFIRVLSGGILPSKRSFFFGV